MSDDERIDDREEYGRGWSDGIAGRRYDPPWFFGRREYRLGYGRGALSAGRDGEVATSGGLLMLGRRTAILGAAKVVPDDAPSTALPRDSNAASYAPYAESAGQIVSSIIDATRQQPPPSTPPPPPPLPREESNTVWYVAGGAAVLAIGAALLVRSR